MLVTRKGAVRAGGRARHHSRQHGRAFSSSCAAWEIPRASRAAATARVGDVPYRGAKRFTLADHRPRPPGVECRKDAGVIDETPAAYKDIDAVMAAQRDLVEIVHTLKQVVCVKG